MSRRLRHRFASRVLATHREEGQVVVVVALCFIVFIGMLGLVLDVGNLHVVQRKLQIAADAAALAGAAQLSNSTAGANTQALSYDGTGGNKNTLSGYTVTTTVLFGCLSSATVGGTISCTPNSGVGQTPFSPQCLPTNTPSCSPNAIRVIETTFVPPIFMGALHFGAKTISATATGSETGGIPIPLDIEMIDDNTASMQASESCTITGITTGGAPTRQDCAKQGIGYLLATLLPCAQNLVTCGAVDNTGNVANPVDRIGLMVTPGMCAIKVNSCGSTLTPGAGSPYTGVPAETGCSTANFTAVGNNATYDYSATPYYYNSTATNSGGYSNYQAVPFESDYRTSDSTTFADPNSPWGALNYLSPSKLVNATWFYQCSGHTFPGDSGGDEQYGMEDPGGAGTYYADAILQAQNTFNAPAAGQIGAGRSNVGHAIIMLSDGDATSGVTDHSKLDTAGTNECQAGINAAMTAEAAGVEFFSVAYGAVTSGCATDTSVIGNVGGTTCYATANLSTNISTDCTARSPLCAMELMADNPQTDSAYNSLYAAEQALCTGPNAYADDPSHHFFNAPTGADFQKAFQAVGVQLTSSRLVPDTAN